eukprot:TRINITY_DN6909_c0_g1_i1.p1 TRINITY_DN6909_c0_g1~~TRINITY_DN6909_c0_g1_i1.p1  ORF type:complete len:1360 (-),score=297.12 TRINITY_DN6909_c0_g1_i1:29-4108(-)
MSSLSGSGTVRKKSSLGLISGMKFTKKLKKATSTIGSPKDRFREQGKKRTCSTEPGSPRVLANPIVTGLVTPKQGEVPLFHKKDGADNIQFVVTSAPLNVDSFREVAAGTLEKLVERLTFEKYPDSAFVDAFLMTYRSFCTPAVLFDLLKCRFRMCPPSNEAQLTVFNRKMMPIRLRVFNVFKTWVTNYWMDFTAHESLATELADFASTEVSECGLAKAADQLKALIGRQRDLHTDDGRRRSETTESEDSDVVHGQIRMPCNILMITSADLANHLAMIDFDLLSRIRPWECLGLRWLCANKQTEAPHVLAVLDRFTLVMAWVATLVVQEEELNARVAVLKHLIETCHHSMGINSFGMAVALAKGLQSPSVVRLKQTWNALRTKEKRLWADCESSLSSNDDYKALRTHMCNKVLPPCVPYLGLMLKDISAVQAKTPDNLSNGIINFEKRRECAKTIELLVRYQRTPMQYPVSAANMKFLKDLQSLSLPDLCKLSYERQPRRGSSSLKGSKSSSPSQLRRKAIVDRTVSILSAAEAMAPDWGPMAEMGASYPFKYKDSPSNILLAKTADDQRVLGATVPKLVERLTHHTYPNTTFLNYFMMTYATFMTSEALLELLKIRWKLPRPTNAEKAAQYALQVERPIQLRILCVLKVWVNKYTDTIRKAADPLLLDKIASFANDFSRTTTVSKYGVAVSDTVNKIKKTLASRQEEKRAYIDSVVFASGDSALQAKQSEEETADKRTVRQTDDCRSVDGDAIFSAFMGFSAVELAHQIAVEEYRLFVRIAPHDVFQIIEGQEDLLDMTDKSSYAGHFARRCEMTERWVCTTIVGQSDVRQRAAVVSRFIAIAKELVSIRNLNGVKVILDGIDSLSNELVNTFEWVSSSDIQTMKLLQTLTDSSAGSLANCQQDGGDGADDSHSSMPPFSLCMARLRNVWNCLPNSFDNESSSRSPSLSPESPVLSRKMSVTNRSSPPPSSSVLSASREASGSISMYGNVGAPVVGPGGVIVSPLERSRTLSVDSDSDALSYDRTTIVNFSRRRKIAKIYDNFVGKHQFENATYLCGEDETIEDNKVVRMYFRHLKLLTPHEIFVRKQTLSSFVDNGSETSIQNLAESQASSVLGCDVAILIGLLYVLVSASDLWQEIRWQEKAGETKGLKSLQCLQTVVARLEARLDFELHFLRMYLGKDIADDDDDEDEFVIPELRLAKQNGNKPDKKKKSRIRNKPEARGSNNGLFGGVISESMHATELQIMHNLLPEGWVLKVWEEVDEDGDVYEVPGELISMLVGMPPRALPSQLDDGARRHIMLLFPAVDKAHISTAIRLRTFYRSKEDSTSTILQTIVSCVLPTPNIRKLASTNSIQIVPL